MAGKRGGMSGRHVIAAGAAVVALGLTLTGVGVLGALRHPDDFAGGAPRTAPQTPSTAPTGEIVLNDRLSIYRPPADSLAADERSGQSFVADELLVLFKPEVTADRVRTVVAGWGGRIVGHLTAVNRFEVLFPQKRSLADLTAYAARLQADPLVEVAYVNYLRTVAPAYEPNDTGWQGQWNGGTKDDGNWGMEAIHAPQLWDYRDEVAKGLAATPVGILDGGFYANNDLKIELASPSAEQDHGTHVAGIIGAQFDNKEGVAGVIPGNAKLVGFSEYAFGDTGPTLPERFKSIYETGTVCYSVSIDELALTYLIGERRLRVVNYSMGRFEDEQMYGASRGNQAAIAAYRAQTAPTRHLIARLLQEHDFLLVVAAGNQGRAKSYWNANPGDKEKKEAGDPLFVADDKAPFGFRRVSLDSLDALWAHSGEEDAAFESDFTFIGSDFDTLTDAADREEAAQVRNHILVVGAAALRDGAMDTTAFSNRGTRVDILAPGGHVESLFGEGEGGYNCGSVRCQKMNGTSMAAPHVTGSAAALWAMKTSQSALEVRDLLLNTRQSSTWCSGRCFLDVGAAATTLHDRLQTEPGGPGNPANAAGTTVTTLVFDTSGSMGEASGRSKEVDDGQGGTRTEDVAKIDAAKEAGQVLLATIRSTAAHYSSEFQVGVAQFSDQARDVILPTTSYDEVGAAIDGLSSGGGTNLVEALKTGTAQLAGRSGTRAAILLSDGKDEAGNSDDAILAAARAAGDQGIKVCTVGFGQGDALNEPLLKQIAQSTGCSYSYADAASSVALAGSFIAAQLQATSTVVGQQTGTVREGETTAAVQFTVPNQTGDLTGVLYWPGSQLELVLVDPDGTRVDARYPGVSVDKDRIPAQMVITDPKPGAWSFAVHGRQTSTPEEPYFAVTAFKPIEREYVTRRIPQLAPDPQPTAGATAPDLAMRLASISLGAGLFLVFVGSAWLVSSRRREYGD